MHDEQKEGILSQFGPFFNVTCQEGYAHFTFPFTFAGFRIISAKQGEYNDIMSDCGVFIGLIVA